MPVSRRRWRLQDLGQLWYPLAVGSAGPGRSQPGAIAATRRPWLSRASCSLAVRSNTWLTRSGTGTGQGSNPAPASADAVGSQVADHAGHGDLRKAGVMADCRTRPNSPRTRSGSPFARRLPSAGSSITGVTRWAPASPTWPDARTSRPTRSSAWKTPAPSPPLPCCGA